MGKRIYAEALELIHNRKSVRSFTDELVSKEDLLIILKAGMDSPSAVNFQPWNFVVVTEKDVLNKLAEGLPYAKMLRNWAAVYHSDGQEKKAKELNDRADRLWMEKEEK